jgi:recombination protein RecR
MAASAGPEIERLIALLAKLPGLGPRSARRAALMLLKKREQLLAPLAAALADAAARVTVCGACGALDSRDPCAICADPGRDQSLLCIVEDVGALWAMERAGAFRGRYHVLGGLLSALDGVRPESLRIDTLVGRARDERVREAILALPATVDGQTTAHYVADRLAGAGVAVTMLARGVPVGGDLDWLDDGTIIQAMRARRPTSG